MIENTCECSEYCVVRGAYVSLDFENLDLVGALWAFGRVQRVKTPISHYHRNESFVVLLIYKTPANTHATQLSP